MKTKKVSKRVKRAVNLTLSKQTIRQGEILQEQLRRPSLSNVVEYLIDKAAEKTAA
jgi:hypothetical protein